MTSHSKDNNEFFTYKGFGELLTTKEVCLICWNKDDHKTRSKLYRLVKNDLFPKPRVDLGTKKRHKFYFSNEEIFRFNRSGEINHGNT
tara:strand:- start:553 stop:816 length:264 start_codon:yes stop_codon:yes gene_type:complete